MKLFQFLSYFVFRVSKARQSPVKPACLSAVDWYLHFEVDHFSPDDVLERRPVIDGKSLFCDFR